MEIQNPNLANTSVGLRYTRDDDGVPVVVHGDERGVFDVPDKDGEFMVATPGWKRVRKAVPVLGGTSGDDSFGVDAPEPALVPKPPKPSTARDDETTTKVSYDGDTQPPPDDDEGEEEEYEEVDLDSMDKDELLALAEEQEIEGINKRWGEERLRAHLSEALEEE